MKEVLNKRQLEAVEATEGMVRVVAGAGSGKTRVLAHRFAFLVNEIGISPANILCLTFTNKAAQEMKRRISKMVDRGSVNDFVCTIHSFCVKFLRREIYRIGFPKTFTVIDTEDARDLARQAMQEFGIDRKKTTAERFLKKVAAFKGMDPSGYIGRHLLPGSSPQCPDEIVRYLRLQLKQYALDYDDLLYITLYILDRFDDAREYWTDRLNYVMVDEVQDCSADDWKLMYALSSRHGNLFVVGDPDQAIYEWRGGAPKLFVGFKADTDIILNENYRSTPDILDVANSIIANNRNRVKKELFTRRLNERRVTYIHYRSEKEEAEGVAGLIAGAAASGTGYGSVAVLYRASHLSRRLEQELLRRQIPYTVWGGVRFFERAEIKDVICYLRLIASDDDDIAFRRVVNQPSRKFGRKSLENLQKRAEAEGISLMSALRGTLAEEGTPRRRPLEEFVALIDRMRIMSGNVPVSELTDTLLGATGLSDLYRNDEEEERLENLTELIGSMREFEATAVDAPDATLPSYLQEIALYVNTDHLAEIPKVRLMTVHQSKGLEFDTVFVTGLTEGIFPSHRSIRERLKDGEEEERRLMYVAVTRAMRMLYLTESEGYLNEGGTLKYPSRFIGEIPEAFLTIEGNPSPTLREGTKTIASLVDGETQGAGESVMPAGTRVSHRHFGEGVVESYNPAAKTYRVRFGETRRDLLPHVLTNVER